MESSTSSLADVLERVLDKGVVIVGDIAVNVVDIELLTLRLRLFIASAQTARGMGMDWWTGDPFFAPRSGQSGQSGDSGPSELDEQTKQLHGRIAELEEALRSRVHEQ